MYLHYGVRQEDMEIIEQSCRDCDIDPEWLKEQVLKRYHEAKVDRIEMDDNATEKVIDKALKELKS